MQCIEESYSKVRKVIPWQFFISSLFLIFPHFSSPFLIFDKSEELYPIAFFLSHCSSPFPTSPDSSSIFLTFPKVWKVIPWQFLISSLFLTFPHLCFTFPHSSSLYLTFLSQKVKKVIPWQFFISSLFLTFPHLFSHFLTLPYISSLLYS